MAGVMLVSSNGCREGCGRRSRNGGEVERERESQLSLIALLVAAIRKSMASCRVERGADDPVPMMEQMEISWPTDVRHVAHVTFDRFHGFLGLPVEFEVDVPGRVPSASASVFGVSAESMQCCYDTKGNSVPTILLLMQDKLYSQEGLKAEGIFRINPENSKEEHVREQLNKGIVPDDIDVHCLAGLIKAWFRELPEGVLDCLSPEQVLDCNTEDECVELVKELLPTQAALLNWAIELMADVVEEEELNKMNARNIAMVFSPNMTQMSDPLTALMHAVQVMNLLKTLILKTLREREDAANGGEYSPYSSSASSEPERISDVSSQQDMDMTHEPRENISDDNRSSDSSDSKRHSSARNSDYNNQQDIDMSHESSEDISDDDHMSNVSSVRRISDARHIIYNCHYDDTDSSESEKEIEESFLKQLVWKELNASLAEGRIEEGQFSIEGVIHRTLSSSSLGSLISTTENQNASCLTTSNETYSDASITRIVFKPEDVQEVEMVPCN